MNAVMNFIIDFSATILMPLMLVVFILGLLVRLAVYITVRSQHHFVVEFEKRSQRQGQEGEPSNGHGSAPKSFYVVLKRLLQKTHVESFDLKHKYKRRNLDYITSLTDRIFLLEEGTQRLVDDTMKRVKYLRRDDKNPHLQEITKNVFNTNPYFTKLFGVLPINLTNDMVNILPGLFVIGGIFGTFLGIMQGLPQLGSMEIANVDATKATMNEFLLKMAYSMVTSIVGIIYSVFTTLANTMMNPDSFYYDLINRYTDSLEHTWNETQTNDVPDEEVVAAQDEKETAQGEALAAGTKPDRRMAS